MAPRRLCAASLLCLPLLAAGDRPQDLVTSLPGFSGPWPFKAYSGILDVPGPVAGYDSLRIHYQFHTSQGNPSKDPVVAWHQGGPGGSSITVGLYGELGAFTISESGFSLNKFAWNRLASMLYLESPAGSGGNAGYSECLKGGVPVTCTWDDVSQGVAYAHTLVAFFKAYPEFAANSLYLAGESYFGQYGPNIANFILSNEPFKSTLKLKGIALGNSCWGGNETCVACNGPSEDKIDVDLLFGYGMYAPSLHRQIYEECKFPTTYTTCMGNSDDAAPVGRQATSQQCQNLLAQMAQEAGPYDVYFIYDNCPQMQNFFKRTGKDAMWLRNYLRRNLHNPAAVNHTLTTMNGGYTWQCDGPVEQWITRPDVQKALHLDGETPGASGFNYIFSGPASITVYPTLVQRLRTLIYSGQADACVPYIGTQDSIDLLVEGGHLKEASPWTPWYLGSNNATAAGYIVKYETVPAGREFTFKTVRLAGHMVPQFQPEAAFDLIGQFLAGEAREEEEQGSINVVV